MMTRMWMCLLAVVVWSAPLSVVGAEPVSPVQTDRDRRVHAQPGELDRLAREQAVKRRAQAAEAARQVAAMEAAMVAARRARVEDIKRQVQASATRELAEIEGRGETPEMARATALKAWLVRYEGKTLEIGGQTVRIEVSEVSRVRAALESPAIPTTGDGARVRDPQPGR